MKIVILGWIEFPFASAGASRLRILSKGWIEQGATVHLITTAKLQSKNDSDNNFIEAELDGFSYESTYDAGNETDLLPGNRRITGYVKAVMKGWKRTRQLINEGQCDVLYFWAWSAFGCYPVMRAAKKKKIPYFFDICEWFPRQNFKWWPVNPFYYDDLIGRQLPGKDCGGVIAITQYIAKKYEQKDVPVLVVPAINNFSDRDVHIDRHPDHSLFRIIYVGFCKDGDGIDLLIKAVKLVKKNNIPVELIIIGADGQSGPSLDYRKMCEMATELKDTVHFKGKIPEKDYFKTLSSANVLALPRKNSQTNQAAFPTRLPEFLITGRPVLITDVPDVPMYLDADVHAKLLISDNVNAIANALVDLWKDDEKAYTIGVAGRSRGIEVFDYRQHTKNIYQLFDTALRK